MGGKRKETRVGFTLLEVSVAIVVLMIALAMVAQLASYGFLERERTGLRQESMEWAENVLEKARASSWEELTPEWGPKQKPPEQLAQRLTAATWAVRVEPEKSQPLAKRVTVSIEWKMNDGPPERSLQLVGIFGPRSTSSTGGKP